MFGTQPLTVPSTSQSFTSWRSGNTLSPMASITTMIAMAARTPRTAASTTGSMLPCVSFISRKLDPHVSAHRPRCSATNPCDALE
jgi:DNA gyrase inhibitor GyrI